MWTQKTLAIKAYFNLKNASVFKNSMESYNVKMKKKLLYATCYKIYFKLRWFKCFHDHTLQS